jgi:RNA polymerase sigma-70 factor (ECF subfamily)
LNNQNIAEDIVQDVFIRIWNKNNYNSIKYIQTYLYQSVKNACLDYLKSNKLKTIPLDKNSSEFIKDDNDYNLLIEEAAKLARIYQLIDKLPPKCKLIFRKVIFEKLSYADVACQMNISVSMVKKQMVKAYKYIKENY